MAELTLWGGLIILFILAASYFVKINLESGINYDVKSSLLRFIILHNPFVLGVYLLIAVLLVVIGLKNRKRKAFNTLIF